jgi:DNA-directed RNA polymerase alpha subunit
MPDSDSSLDKTPIEELQLSLQPLGFLKRMQINTLADLMNYTEEDLITLDRESGQVIIEALYAQFGLRLPTDDLL